jgi:hypothetical protein
MQKSDEYLKHARECRALAKQMEQGVHRDQLMKMAETWEVLAAERERTHRATDPRPAAAAPLPFDEKPTTQPTPVAPDRERIP